MEAAIAKNEFLEYAEVHSNVYGTRCPSTRFTSPALLDGNGSKDSIKCIRDAGRVSVLDVDVQGVQKIKAAGLSANFLFISPPSLESLERRLRAR
jgi:guanylate kinase